MTEHTKGPWAYRPREDDDWGVVRGPDGRLVASAKAGRDVSQDEYAEHRQNGTDPYEDNARLIAAAPMMYEALDRIFSYISYVNIHGVGEQPDPTPEIGPQPLKCPPDEFWRIFQDIGDRASAAMRLVDDAAKAGARK
jgi:hypothetical protein